MMASAIFLVKPLRGLKDAPRSMTIKLELESMVILDGEAKDVFCRFSYYKILCWGWSPQVFQWKAYPDDDDETPAVYSVSTVQGEECVAALMDRVHSLMSDMEARCVPADKFTQLLNALEELAEDGLADHCLTAVRQMAIGRAFDARQAVMLVQTIGQISPFDKLEAAVALFPSLLGAESFHVVLASFDDAGDRDNILHRLHVQIGSNGSIVHMPGAKKPKGGGA